jgi:energy-converting hydrogenase A subunit M
MEILGVLWSDDVIDKLARLHTVADDEVEEVFFNALDFRRRKRNG